MAKSAVLGDATPTFANDDCDFTFVVQFLGLRGAGQRMSVAHKRPRKTGKEGHVRRGFFAVFVFSVAVREIDAHADDFLRVVDRNLEAKPARE